MKRCIKKPAIAFIITIVAVAIVTGLYFLLPQDSGLDIDDSAKKYEANIQKPEDWGNNKIAIPGYGDIQMEEATDIFHVALYNPSDNPCYFVFHVIVEGEELYKSKLVPPGEAITNARLSKKIDKGTHEVTIRIDTYDLSDGKTPMNGSEVKTRIITYSK